MRLLLISFLAACFVAGCTAVELKDPQIIMAKKAQRGIGPSDITDTFTMDSQVLAYITFKWPEVNTEGGNRDFTVKWFCNNIQVSELTRTLPVTKPPFSYWPHLTAASLGKGDCRIDVFVDKRFVGTKAFRIVGKDAI